MGQKAEVVAARQLYIYGNGDGKRVIGVKALVEATGLSETTIGKHLPKWQAEVEEILMNADSSTLGLQLSAKDLQLHKECMNTLSDQIKQIQWELDKHADIVADLREWARETSDLEFSMRLLETYLRTSGAKATLRSQFLSYQKQFATLSGVVDLKDISVVSAKEIAKGKAKLDLKKLESEAGMKPAGPPTNGVFARPAQNISAQDQ